MSTTPDASASPKGREARPIGKNTLGDTVIFDIDGTLAHNDRHRGYFEWHKVGGDKPMVPIINIAKMYQNAGYKIIIVSGREGTPICRNQTEQWLLKHGILYYALFMRGEKDFRRDSIIKAEIYDKFIKDVHNVEVVFDDRQQVVDFWRSIGLKCLQVEPGDF